MPICLLLFLLLPVVSCNAPGPLDDFMKEERKSDDIFAPSEDNVVVVEAVLFVDAPLPPVQLRRTVAPGAPYSADAAAMTGIVVQLVLVLRCPAPEPGLANLSSADHLITLNSQSARSNGCRL